MLGGLLIWRPANYASAIRRVAVLIVLLACFATAPVAGAATPADGEWEAGNGASPHIAMTVAGGGTRISRTNSFLHLSDFCGWGGAWNRPTDPLPELPPIEIAPDGSFSTFGGPEQAFGVTSTWTGVFTSETTFTVTVVLDDCPFDDGPRTLTIDGVLTEPAEAPPIGPIKPPTPAVGAGGSAGGQATAVSCTADQVGWPVADVPPLSEHQVGKAVALGCFTDAGGGVFTTQLPARIGGFVVQPRKPGGGLRIDTRAGTAKAIGSAWVMLDPRFDRVGIPVSWLPVKRESAKLALPEVVDELVDLPVAKSVELSWDADGRGATLKGEVGWERAKQPIDAGVRILAKAFDGSIALHLTNARGLEVANASVQLKGLDLLGEDRGRFFPFRLRDVGATLELTDQGRLWTFSGGWETRWRAPGAEKNAAITVRVKWLRGIVGGGGEVDGVQIPIGPTGMVLQKVGLELIAKPSFGEQLTGAATLGPKIKEFSLFEIDPATFGLGWYARECPDPSGPVARIAGTGKVPPVTLMKGKIEAALAFCTDLVDAFLAQGRLPRLVDVSGSFNVELTFGSAAFEGEGSGWIAGGRRFQLEGTGRGRFFTIRSDDAQMLLSEQGLVICVDRKGLPSSGAAWPWGGLPKPLVPCGLELFRRPRPRASRALQGAAAVRVPPGQRSFAIRVDAPRVRVTGPGGRTIESPASGDVADLGDALVLRVPERGQTYVLIGRPQAGSWTVEPLDGAALGEVATAAALPRLRARAQVSDRGTRRVLRYRLNGVGDRKLELWDRTARAGRRLRTVRGGTGRLRFRPVRGGSAHRIELLVRRQGFVTERRVLARFHARSVVRAGRVRGLVVRRRGSRLTLRWRSSRRAQGYLVRTRVRRRGEFVRLVTGRRTRLVVPRRGRVVVRVAALGRDGRLGGVAVRAL